MEKSRASFVIDPELANPKVSLIETRPDERFDRITRLAMRLFQVPIAAVSVLDSEHQWFKSCQGLPASRIPRDASFCKHTLGGSNVLQVTNTLEDSRFADHPLVTGEPYIRFYAGFPLGSEDANIGTLCIMDCRPRTLSPEEVQLLKDLGSWAGMELIRIRQLESLIDRKTKQLEHSEETFFSILDSLPVGVFVLKPGGAAFYANKSARQMLGKGITSKSDVDHLAEVYKVYVTGTNQEYPVRRMPIVKALEGISSEVDDMDIHRPDGILSVQVWGSPVYQKGEIVFALAAFQDITQRRQTELRLAVQQAISDLLSYEAELEVAPGKVLKTICQNLKWDVGALWLVDSDRNVLRCAEVWCAPPAGAPEFEALSRKMTFDPASGFPGRVWQEEKPQWIVDVTEDSNFPRTPAALKNGLHSALGFPIRLNDQMIGVLEFFSRSIHQPDRPLLSMLSSFGNRLGRLLANTPL